MSYRQPSSPRRLSERTVSPIREVSTYSRTNFSKPLSPSSSLPPTPHRFPFSPERSPSPSHRFPLADPVDAPPRRGTPPRRLQALEPHDLHALEDEPLSPAANRHLSTPTMNTPSISGQTGTVSRFSDDMSVVIPPKSSIKDPVHWTMTLKWVFGFLIMVVSGAVAILMGHSLSLYGGDKEEGTIDMADADRPKWDSGLNLLPTWLLLAVGFVSACSSVMVAGLSLRRRFMKPVVWLEKFRLGAGIFSIGAWVASLIVFKLFETGSTESLSSWACGHWHSGVRGGNDFRRVCTEQNAGFILAIVAAILEVLMIGCFAASVVFGKKQAAMDFSTEKRIGKSRA